MKDAFTRRSAIALLCLSGCGRYADFSLPSLAGANALSFEWKPDPSPVLSPGSWDSIDVLAPSVVLRDHVYYNLYSGYDGKTWHTGLATSSDGVEWRKRGKILSPQPDTWEGSYIAGNGSAIVNGSEFYYWYVTGPRARHKIGLARSADGLTWRKQPDPVLPTGPRGSWDEISVADPAVLRIGDSLYMFYLGQDRARRQRIGIARSADGRRWWKLRTNPILELGERDAFDENGLGEPAVWQSHGQYWMLYRGQDRKQYRRLGLAQSADGVHWQKVSAVFQGAEAWNSKVICDPSVLVEGDSIRCWFGGGDVASPDENLHGQIGVARLVPKR